ncbi:MAG: hypothetical protein LBE82_00840 [Chitinophagaceae bacterium]|jgi:hypothetical protein|nr:hypothetical protein [Chitinophagaceae bacterium]
MKRIFRRLPARILFTYFFFLFIAVAWSFALKAQVTGASVDSILSIPDSKKDLRINYVPFGNVLVLDNRFDTTAFFSFEDGKYPLVTTIFAQPLSIEIKNYIENAITELKKGNDTYLFNIKQFKIGNAHAVVERNKKNIDIRSNVIVSADIYRQTGENQYAKVLSINTSYPVIGKLNAMVAGIINAMIEASALTTNPAEAVSDKPKKLKNYLKENSGYDYVKDAATSSMEAININARNKWSEYPINKMSNRSSGYYKNFDDFRNNILTAMPIAFSSEKENEAYKVSNTLGSPELRKLFSAYALCDSNSNIFYRLPGNKFVKLLPKDNTFYFTVPASSPNMYSLLSMADVQVPDYSAYTGGGILGAIIGNAIENAELRKKRKQIASNEMTNFFRKCYIDMDSGDIIYDF